jgi:hypothetical protein
MSAPPLKGLWKKLKDVFTYQFSTSNLNVGTEQIRRIIQKTAVGGDVLMQCFFSYNMIKRESEKVDSNKTP